LKRSLFLIVLLAAIGCGERDEPAAAPPGRDKPAPVYQGEAFAHPWPHGEQSRPVWERIPPPPGYGRIPAAKGSFGSWLRSLPVKPGRPEVRLHNGGLKSDQSVHHAVLDIDVGGRDLQQCADAVIRLRAEYLLCRGRADEIAFNFTSGDRAEWVKWKGGYRPHVRGRAVSWSRTARPDASYAGFRKYLDVVFTYAGSASLEKELSPVSAASEVEPGQVFIKGGFPGHAVIVLDVAADRQGGRVMLLAQSYMPAQEIHVLRNPGSALSPWYPVDRARPLQTPEWTFSNDQLRRFPD